MEDNIHDSEEVKVSSEDNNTEVSAKSTDTSEPQSEELNVTNKAVEMLRTVFDPEIPVNVYDLGLIYKIDYDTSDKTLHVDMTLTAPSCPAADFIVEDVRQKLVSIEGPEKLDLQLVFEPEWNQDMMSEEAKLELGFL
ncbi:MAG: metal-sulfur cluster assembly factor [Muribaculaceae bacterium]|nr:metal-sulfur cluster assembly factor [Muribaculaceae bacterium]